MNVKFINEKVKANYNSNLPAPVRYDVNINDKCKLLYAEISASINHLGYCDLDNTYFSALFGLSERSISKYISDLTSRRYIEIEIVQNNKRRIIIPTQAISFIQAPTLKEDLEVFEKEDQEFIDKYLDTWCKKLDTKIYLKHKKYKAVYALMQVFTKTEMEDAMENRINYVENSEWHKQAENKHHVTNIELLIRDEDALAKWLRMSNYNKKEDGEDSTITAFSYD